MKSTIIKPVITEKSMGLTPKGWFTFHAVVFADKKTLQKEIEQLYNVQVTAIRTSHMHGKVRQVGRKGSTVAKSDWKKIYVHLKTGQTIDAFQIGGPEEKK